MLRSRIGRVAALAAGVLLAATCLGCGSSTPAVVAALITHIREATGADAAAIQASIDTFRNDLGANNGGDPGSVGSGRREINWDGVPDGSASPNAFPGDFFNFTAAPRARGAVFTTPGTGLQVSADDANPTMDSVRFGHLNGAYENIFAVFSPQRLFAPLGSTVVVATFFVPGSNTPAGVNGFGAVFTDVDAAGTTSMQFLDRNGNELTSRTVLATAGDGSMSFLGIRFDQPAIASVRITSGEGELDPASNDGAGNDLVVMDDFIYGEPIALP